MATYSWDKLVDRCLVFTDASRKALLLFLQEAEVELTRKVNMMEHSVTISPPNDAYWFTMSFKDFKEVKTLFHKGNQLRKIEEKDLNLNNSNLPFQGTPSRFYVETTKAGFAPVYKLIFDRIPPDSSIFKLYYWALATPNLIGPTVPGQYHTDLCYYAIAQVTAKANPEIFREFTSLWGQSIMAIKNESADKDLIYNIDEVI
tara:strand:- start:818 stop:1423 length:606 start_codon:yes stop_codon:yes gene_type:complete